MSIEQIFDSASSVMTVISFITFSAILGWTFWRHSEQDFAVAAALPFDDEEDSHV
ncbi:MAG: cbb3-type cytochrome oxidase subunit 3 [Sphingomonadaceae bacterium]